MISAADLPSKVIICSRNRAAWLAKHPLLGVAHVCVDTEYEAAQYRNVFGKVGRSPHDLHVLGESRTLCDSRQDALDLLWDRDEPFALKRDEDVSAFLPMMHYRTVRIVDPDAMLTILWSTYVSTSEMPTGIFGYAHTARPAERRANTPIRLRVWVDNTIMGILDRELSTTVAEQELVEWRYSRGVEVRRWLSVRMKWGKWPGGLRGLNGCTSA